MLNSSHYLKVFYFITLCQCAQEISSRSPAPDPIERAELLMEAQKFSTAQTVLEAQSDLSDSAKSLLAVCYAAQGKISILGVLFKVINKDQTSSTTSTSASSSKFGPLEFILPPDTPTNKDFLLKAIARMDTITTETKNMHFIHGLLLTIQGLLFFKPILEDPTTLISIPQTDIEGGLDIIRSAVSHFNQSYEIFQPLIDPLTSFLAIWDNSSNILEIIDNLK